MHLSDRFVLVHRFTVVPVILSIVLSFTYFNMLEFPKWIGWANYIRLFLADEVFLIAVKNTLLFAAITGPVSYMMCFIFAWIINELQPKVRAFLTLLFYAPSISGSAYTIWQFIFSQDTYGYINAHLLNLNIVDKPIGWLIEPKYMMTIVIIVTLWMSLGTSFLAFIAGLQESALHCTKPVPSTGSKPVAGAVVSDPAGDAPVFDVRCNHGSTGSFNAAGNIQALTGPNPTDYATWTVMQHLNDYGTVRYEMGYASAISVVLFFVMVGSQRLVQRMLHRIGN